MWSVKRYRKYNQLAVITQRTLELKFEITDHKLKWSCSTLYMYNKQAELVCKHDPLEGCGFLVDKLSVFTETPIRKAFCLKVSLCKTFKCHRWLDSICLRPLLLLLLVMDAGTTGVNREPCRTESFAYWPVRKFEWKTVDNISAC